MRSAIAPDTMVAAVAAKTVWKSKKAYIQLASSPKERASGLGKNSPQPKIPSAAPNMRPKPIAQNARAPMEKSIRFFMRMLTAFLARVKPHSTRAKPACMKNTRKAATQVQYQSKWEAAVAT